MSVQQSFKNQKNTLFVVSTPIGNLKDITFRAIETLKNVDIILAEDTRVSGILLKHYGIDTRMMSYHDFNKESKNDYVIELLNNHNIAIISDAGTPGINDPGYELIQLAIKSDYNVVAIPGASAILAGLISSGLLIQPFTFLGFLPRKKSELIKTIFDYKYRKETLVIYESPQRIKETITLIYETIGNRNISLLRELTKIHETIIRDELSNLINTDLSLKGEYVLIIEGNNSDSKFLDLSIEEHYHHYLKQGYSDKEAMKLVATDRSIPKSEVYKIIKTN